MPCFDIICLANSRKLGGHCVAGLRTDGSGWIRPVGTAPDGILWPKDYTLANGTPVKPLDVMRVTVSAPRPACHQPENWVIDGSRWLLVKRPSDQQIGEVLRQALVRGPELLSGLDDRVPYAQFEKQRAAASLALVAPEDLYLYHHLTYSGKLQARGRFPMGTGERTVLYDLPITEPRWEATISRQGPNTLRQSQGKFLVTISLAEPFAEHCYKIIAAIMPLPASLADQFNV